MLKDKGVLLISGGLGQRQLEAGFQSPGQRPRLGPGSEGAESWPLDQWLVTRPWPFGFAERNSHRDGK